MTNQEEFLKEALALTNKPIKELKEKYQKLYGDKKVVPSNKTFLVKRIIFKLQELKHDGLSQAAKDKADSLIRKHDPVNNSAKSSKSSVKSGRDPRLPIPGTIIAKVYNREEARGQSFGKRLRV